MPVALQDLAGSPPVLGEPQAWARGILFVPRVFARCASRRNPRPCEKGTSGHGLLYSRNVRKGAANRVPRPKTGSTSGAAAGKSDAAAIHSLEMLKKVKSVKCFVRYTRLAAKPDAAALSPAPAAGVKAQSPPAERGGPQMAGRSQGWGKRRVWRSHARPKLCGHGPAVPALRPRPRSRGRPRSGRNLDSQTTQRSNGCPTDSEGGAGPAVPCYNQCHSGKGTAAAGRRAGSPEPKSRRNGHNARLCFRASFLVRFRHCAALSIRFSWRFLQRAELCCWALCKSERFLGEGAVKNSRAAFPRIYLDSPG